MLFKSLAKKKRSKKDEEKNRPVKEEGKIKTQAV